jgi:hypothetical protein
MLVRISIYQEVDTKDFELVGNTVEEEIAYLVDRFAEDLEKLAVNNILKDQIQVEYL